MNGWQPMATAPKDGTPIGIWTRGGSLVKAVWTWGIDEEPETGEPRSAWVAAREGEHPFDWEEGVCRSDSDQPALWIALPDVAGEGL